MLYVIRVDFNGGHSHDNGGLLSLAKSCVFGWTDVFFSFSLIATQRLSACRSSSRGCGKKVIKRRDFRDISLRKDMTWAGLYEIQLKRCSRQGERLLTCTCSFLITRGGAFQKWENKDCFDVIENSRSHSWNEQITKSQQSFAVIFLNLKRLTLSFPSHYSNQCLTKTTIFSMSMIRGQT